ncbi:MAG: hypothetical protein ACTSX9_08095 [Candidatus Njordarchaeales archaeon]
MISPEMILEVFIIIAILVAAIYVAEASPVSRAVGGFMLFSMLVAILFLYLGYPYLAAFQATIYAGAVSSLLLLYLSITKAEVIEVEEEEK